MPVDLRPIVGNVDWPPGAERAVTRLTLFLNNDGLLVTRIDSHPESRPQDPVMLDVLLAGKPGLNAKGALRKALAEKHTVQIFRPIGTHSSFWVSN